MNTPFRLLPAAVVITGSSIMVGCGGRGSSCGSNGSYGSYGSSAACLPPQSYGGPGIYEGTLLSAASEHPTTVVAIIAENGDGRMSGGDGTFYRLHVGTTSGLNGSFQAYTSAGTLPGAGQMDSGMLSTTPSTAGFSGTLTDSSGDTQALALSFDSTYELQSSLAMLVGTWSYTALDGFTLTATVRPDGTFSGLDSNNCSYAGTFALLDPATNVYSEQHVRTCNGAQLSFTGLASYFPANGNYAAQLRVLTDDGAGDYLAAGFQ